MGLCYRTLRLQTSDCVPPTCSFREMSPRAACRFALREPLPLPSEGVVSSRKEVALQILKRKNMSQVLDLQS